MLKKKSQEYKYLVEHNPPLFGPESVKQDREVFSRPGPQREKGKNA